MNMIHHFMGCIREYKKPTILTLLCMVGEVAIEVLIPFFTANLVNEIKGGAELSGVVRVGLGLILMSLVSLGCGALGGLYGSRASAGFAKNVRHDVFTRVQSFAFENIDKFSSASLVTRMTTDINNVQMSFMMCIRIAVRAPLMFLFAVIMAYIMGGALATTFLIIIPVLVIGLLLIARKAMPAFRAVFRKYDKLNESVEENVRAMRVVKGFAREGYEKQKFAAASHDIAKDFTFAERVVPRQTPPAATRRRLPPEICAICRLADHHHERRHDHRRWPALGHADLRHADLNVADDDLDDLRDDDDVV